MWLGKASFCDPNVFSSSYLPAIVICRFLFTKKMQAVLYTLYKFHFLNGISEINKLFDDILII